MLTHDNLLYNGSTSFGHVVGYLRPGIKQDFSEERIISHLPLSHIGGLFVDVMIYILMGCHLYFAKPDALQGSLIHSLRWARPTFIFTVPRAWEKLEDHLNQMIAEGSAEQ